MDSPVGPWRAFLREFSGRSVALPCEPAGRRACVDSVSKEPLAQLTVDTNDDLREIRTTTGRRYRFVHLLANAAIISCHMGVG